MNEKIIGIIAVIVLLGGGWYMFANTEKASAPEGAVTNQMPVIGSTTPEMIVENAPPAVTVTYTDAGFSPKSVSVPLGTTVTFVNQSTGGMWVGSAKHPSHIVYSGTELSAHCPDTSGTAFDQCAASASGSSYSFTFAKVGTWGYHNHVKSSDFGSITVTATATSTTVAPI